MNSASTAVAPSHTCYACHITGTDQQMFQCPTCQEFTCSCSATCDGGCRCDLVMNFRPTTGEMPHALGTEAAGFIKDENSRYVSVSEEYKRIFDAQIGYTDHELLGDSGVADRIRENDLAVLHTGETQEHINTCGRGNSIEYWMVRKSLIFASGKRMITGVCWNVTALVKMAGVVGLMCGLLVALPVAPVRTAVHHHHTTLLKTT